MRKGNAEDRIRSETTYEHFREIAQKTTSCYLAVKSFQNLKDSLDNQNNYFNLHVCLSTRPYCLTVVICVFTAPIPAVLSQNVTYKGCLVCVKSEKYAS